MSHANALNARFQLSKTLSAPRWLASADINGATFAKQVWALMRTSTLQLHTGRKAQVVQCIYSPILTVVAGAVFLDLHGAISSQLMGIGVLRKYFMGLGWAMGAVAACPRHKTKLVSLEEEVMSNSW